MYKVVEQEEAIRLFGEQAKNHNYWVVAEENGEISLVAGYCDKKTAKYSAFNWNNREYFLRRVRKNNLTLF